MLINTGNDFRPGAEPEKRRAAVMFKAFSLMGVDCLALSEREFVFGADYLRELAARSSVPLVCANLKDTKVQGAYFMSCLRLKRAGKNILVTAVLDPSKASLLKPKGLEVGDPVASLRRIQDNISHDLFIVVMQTDKATANKWMARLSGIDVVILGQQRGVQKKAEKLHGAQLLYNCNRGQTVSAVEVSLSKVKKPLPVPDNFLLRANDFSEDPQIATLVKNFESWLHSYHARRQHTSQIKAQKNVTQSGLPAIFQQLIEQNKKNNHSSSFIGVQRCAKCHQQKVVIWKKTRHARAMATLEAKHRENDPDCYRCHVTGIVGVGVTQTAAAGRQPENPFAKLIHQREQGNHRPNVQCEVCHGPGLRHAAKPGKKTKMTIPGDHDCRQCHTQDTDPDFSFGQKKKLICQ